jgi:hypothetical protein
LLILIAVLLAAFVTTFILIITRILNRLPYVKPTIAILALLLFYILAVYAIKFFPENGFRIIAQWVSIYKNIMSGIDAIAVGNPLNTVVNTAFGVRIWSTLFKMVMTIIVTFAFVFIFTRTIYFSLVAANQETARHKHHKLFNFDIKVPFSYYYLVKKEMLVASKEPIEFFKNYFFFFISPIIILYFNRLISAMPLTSFGVDLQLIGNFIMIAILYLSLNIATSEAMRKESLAILYLKTLPISKYNYFLAKMTINFIISLIGISLCSNIVYVFSDLTAIEATTMFLGLLCLAFGHLMYTLGHTIRTIKLENNFDEDTTTGNSLLLALVISFFFAFTYVMNVWDQTTKYGTYRTLFGTVVYLGYNIVMFILNIKAFYPTLGVEVRENV